jgi:hypothetical protein
MITYKKHAKDWQRPLKNTEVACYYSHWIVDATDCGFGSNIIDGILDSIISTLV